MAPRFAFIGFGEAGSTISRSLRDVGVADIATYDIQAETLTRLTFEGTNSLPVWSPDGRWIAFSSVRGTEFALMGGDCPPLNATRSGDAATRV